MQIWGAVVLLTGVACSWGSSGGSCEAPREGTWTASGACFGMSMTSDLKHGSDGCSFSLSNWNMEMSVPAGGSVRGSTVKISGDQWNGCTGTTDGASIHGTCPDGCT